MQYVGKSKTKFNIRLNNHRKDVTKKESIPASNHFEIERHNLNTHAKFILIEQLDQTHLGKLTPWKRLEIRENFSPRAKKATPKRSRQNVEQSIVLCYPSFFTSTQRNF